MQSNFTQSNFWTLPAASDKEMAIVGQLKSILSDIRQICNEAIIQGYYYGDVLSFLKKIRNKSETFVAEPASDNILLNKLKLPANRNPMTGDFSSYEGMPKGERRFNQIAKSLMASKENTVVSEEDPYEYYAPELNEIQSIVRATRKNIKHVSKGNLTVLPLHLEETFKEFACRPMEQESFRSPIEFRGKVIDFKRYIATVIENLKNMTVISEENTEEERVSSAFKP